MTNGSAKPKSLTKLYRSQKHFGIASKDIDRVKCRLLIFKILLVKLGFPAITIAAPSSSKGTESSEFIVPTKRFPERALSS